MISTRVRFKIHYFDRNVIKTRWPRMNRDPLLHAGNLVMRIARGSIRRRIKKRGKPSPAGSPPYSRKPGSTPPFKQIFSVPNFIRTSVVVGMVGYGGNPPVPGLHEQMEGQGGTAQRFIFRKGSQRRLRSGRFGKRRVSYKRETVRYPRRPFMSPALTKAKARLPHMWAYSLSNG